MIIVSDTSPISNLFKIGRLDLLRQVFGKVILPQAVMTELLELEKRGIDLSPIKNAEWIEIKAVQEQAKVQVFLAKMIDEGESEAIVLAKELAADFLLIDEALGRKIAESEGLKVIGLLGVLRDAKKLGYLSEIKPIIQELRQTARFRLSEALIQLILTEAGELDN
ncbi:MAG: DUF3368 domain-containing protein [Bacteroidota bacterium]